MMRQNRPREYLGEERSPRGIQVDGNKVGERAEASEKHLYIL